jgi:branched-chain amino acid transport system ATP-binding protein
MLELHKVSRAFGGLQAVMQVDMIVPENKIVGLIGPNGAGKTTLINCISGLDHPSKGVIRFANTDIQHVPAYRITALGLARTYQNIRLLGQMTVLENLIVAQHHHGKSTLLHSLLQLPSHRREVRDQHERALALLERFHLLNVQDTPAGSLPYGDQRRLEMARALATRPKMLLLDEPTAGMNPTETRAFGEQILKVRDEGLTLLVIEHDMSLIAQVCDEVYVLNFGQVIAYGTPQEINQDDAVIEAYLGKKD